MLERILSNVLFCVSVKVYISTEWVLLSKLDFSGPKLDFKGSFDIYKTRRAKSNYRIAECWWLEGTSGYNLVQLPC